MLTANPETLGFVFDNVAPLGLEEMTRTLGVLLVSSSTEGRHVFVDRISRTGRHSFGQRSVDQEAWDRWPRFERHLHRLIGTRVELDRYRPLQFLVGAGREAVAHLAEIDEDKRASPEPDRGVFMILGRPSIRLGIRMERAPDGRIRLRDVERGSIGERDGLEPGDVFRSVAGEDVNSVYTIGGALKDHDVGQSLEFVVERAGVERTIAIRLELDEP